MTMRESTNTITRCGWVNNDDPYYVQYHDDEWGKPVFDSNQLFEMLCLSGQQAGISWYIIFKKRDNYRKAFFDFKPHLISGMSTNDIDNLLLNKGILRNKSKINSIINNAKCFLEMERNGEDFSSFIWSFVNDTPIINNWANDTDVPTQNEISLNMAKALKKRKFSYVGSTICYAYMQSCGLINDHTLKCFLHNKDHKNKKSD